MTIDTDAVAPVMSYTPPAGAPKDVAPPPQVDASGAPKKVVIPAKYKDPKASGITWEVKGGKNDKTIELTD